MQYEAFPIDFAPSETFLKKWFFRFFRVFPIGFSLRLHCKCNLGTKSSRRPIFPIFPDVQAQKNNFEEKADTGPQNSLQTTHKHPRNAIWSVSDRFRTIGNVSENSCFSGFHVNLFPLISLKRSGPSVVTNPWNWLYFFGEWVWVQRSRSPSPRNVFS